VTERTTGEMQDARRLSFSVYVAGNLFQAYFLKKNRSLPCALFFVQCSSDRRYTVLLAKIGNSERLQCS